MILIQTFALATIGLFGFLLLALYVEYVDKLLTRLPHLEDRLGFYVVMAAGGVTLLIMYGGVVAQVFYWTGG